MLLHFLSFHNVENVHLKNILLQSNPYIIFVSVCNSIDNDDKISKDYIHIYCSCSVSETIAVKIGKFFLGIR